MNNKFFSLFIALISFVLAFIGDVQAQSTIVEQGGIGSCGTGCSWVLYDNGKLEVTGTGENASIASKSHAYSTEKGHTTTMPWSKYLYDVTDVEIKGISNIGQNAFRGMKFVERINMDETTTSIGYASLETGRNVSIVVPDSVTTFERDVFLSNASVYCSAQKKNLCMNAFYTVNGYPNNVKEYTKNPDGTYSLIENNREVEKFASLRDFQNGNSFEKYGYDKSGHQYLLGDNGQLFLKQSDGSSYYFNEEGELVSIKGKRIYTVDEATFMTSKGKNKNTFSIRYR